MTTREPLRIRATLHARGPAACVILDEEQVTAIAGGQKTPPVRVTVNHGHTFAGRIGRMGDDILLGFNRAVRKAAGVQAGDVLDLEIVHDDAPREVEVPEDLAAALAGDDDARAAFAGLAYTHRKEFARWVGDARRPETRRTRVAKTLIMLREGRRP